jgi:hypothetical protein
VAWDKVDERKALLHWRRNSEDLGMGVQYFGKVACPVDD